MLIPDRCLTFGKGVTLLGGGALGDADLDAAMAFSGHLVCADGGADRLAGQVPDAIVGDLDSLTDHARWQGVLGDRLIRVNEQDSTDFEKCLRLVDAPFFIGIGFLGGRLDHSLAALQALITDPRRIVLVGEDDVVMAAGTEFSACLEPGDRVSVYPLLPVRARASSGLKWPLAGLELAAGRRIGTSNSATGSEVSISFDQPGAIIILPRSRLNAALLAKNAGR